MGAGEIFFISVSSVLQVVAVAAIGAYFTKHHFAQHKKTIKDISKLSAKLLLPSLIITNIAITIDSGLIVDSWVIVICAIVFISSALVIGWIAAKLFVPPHLRSLVICAIGLQNAVGIPLPLLLSICDSVSWLKSDDDNSDRATAYVFCYSIVARSMIWSLGYFLLNQEYVRAKSIVSEVQPASHYIPPTLSVDADKSTHNKRVLSTLPHDDQLTVPLIAHTQEGKHDSSNSFDFENIINNNMNPSHDFNAICHNERELRKSINSQILCEVPAKDVERYGTILLRRLDKIYTKLLNNLNEPLIAQIIGFLIALTPLHSVFVPSDAPLMVVFKAMQLMAGASMPVLLFITGGNLSDGPLSEKVMPRNILMLIAFCRLLIVPLYTTILIYFGIQLGILTNDPVLHLVLLVEGAAPTAINLSVIASIHGKNEATISTILFWVYIPSIFTLTMFTTVGVIYLTETN